MNKKTTRLKIEILLAQAVVCAAWAFLAFIVYASLSPIAARPQLTNVHAEHLGAFLMLGLLFGLGYPRHLLATALLVIASAVGLEILQTLTLDRHGRLSDLVEKGAGGLIGLAIARLILLLVQRVIRSHP